MATGDYRILQENGSGGWDEKTITSVANKYLGFDGSKNFTTLDGSGGGDTTTTEGALINSATSKTTPVDADQIGLMDSAASNILKKLSWANIKATLKTYFDTLYLGAMSINSQSGTTYTLVLSDANNLVRCNNASAITVTVPTNASVAFPVPTVISIEQQGAGIVTASPGGGVTINSTARKTWGQNSVIQLIKVGTDTWNVINGTI